MAIKISNITVIDDNRRLQNVGSLTGTYSNFHPNVSTITTVIDFTKPMMKLAMTGNVTFTESNTSEGRNCVLMLDTSASAHTPTFPSAVTFPTAVTWSSARYWVISFHVTASTTRATAIPYSSVPAAPPLAASFTIPSWSASNARIQVPTGQNAEAFAYVRVLDDTASNNRIDVTYAGGTNATQATVYHTYISTASITGITSIQAQYNVVQQSCFGNCSSSGYSYGPTPADDGINSGTYYNLPVRFGWFAKSLSGSTGTTSTSFNLNTANPDFRIKVVCNQGTLYSTCEFSGATHMLSARAGTEL